MCFFFFLFLIKATEEVCIVGGSAAARFALESFSPCNIYCCTVWRREGEGGREEDSRQTRVRDGQGLCPPRR